MQISIFHVIAESNIIKLVSELNNYSEYNQEYKLLSTEYLSSNLIMITAFNGKEFMLNIVDQEGNIPKGYSANWRTSSVLMEEFGELIPEPLVVIRISELNKILLSKGHDWDHIDKIWNNILKN